MHEMIELHAFNFLDPLLRNILEKVHQRQFRPKKRFSGELEFIYQNSFPDNLFVHYLNVPVDLIPA
jgi:hypothetical protein